MAIKRDKIAIEIMSDAPAAPGTAQINTCCAENGVLHLARLIGRQIAREQFEGRQAKDRRSGTDRGNEPIR
jgi:hypothetical protein